MFRVNLIRYQIRYFSSEVKLHKGTLTLRFHDYLTNNHVQEQPQKSRIIEEIEKISERGKGKVDKFKIMDRSYMKSLRNQLPYDDMIKCLEYLVKTYPNQLLNLRFFDESLKILLENDEIGRQQFIKLCYFIGFLKKFQPGPKYLKYLIDKCLDDKLSSNELNRMDFAIFCISTYKSSVRIFNNNKFHDRLIAEVLATNDNDTYLLVAFIKSLKQNEIVSSQVISKLKELITSFDFDYASLVHILPYIADNSIKDDNLIQLICSKCIDTFDDNVRAKDVQKFLHSCAMLNLKMNKSDLLKLEEIIINRTLSEEFKTHFDHFINAALSSWILNHQSNRLINILFEDSRFYKSGLENRLKLDSRKLLLQTCVEIEQPKWIKSKSTSFLETRTSPGYLIKSSLEQAMNTVLADKKGIFVQQIKNLNIAGILVIENSEKVHYEILDEKTCLSDKKTANGIFQLKLRLLRKMKCNVKVLKIF